MTGVCAVCERTVALVGDARVVERHDRGVTGGVCTGSGLPPAVCCETCWQITAPRDWAAFVHDGAGRRVWCNRCWAEDPRALRQYREASLDAALHGAENPIPEPATRAGGGPT